MMSIKTHAREQGKVCSAECWMSKHAREYSRKVKLFLHSVCGGWSLMRLAGARLETLNTFCSIKEGVIEHTEIAFFS